MAGNTLEGLLDIPQQSKPSADSFDTRPKHVEAWVAALPMANIGESARRVFNTLKEINRLDISEQDRFQALEAFRKPVYYITEALKKHYTNENLPLSGKTQRIAELAIQLNAEMAMGYKSVIDSKLSRTFSRLSNKTLMTSIHRAIRYLSNVMLCSYQIYIQHPENTWLQIHRLYLFAEENNLHNAIVKDQVVHDALHDSTVRHVYKQILLLALAGPYRLRQRVIAAVYEALDTWADHCRVLPMEEATEKQMNFTVNLNSDAAPGYFRVTNVTDTDLVRAIDTNEMTKVMSSATIPSSKTTGIPEDIVKKLLITWNGQSRRTFSRTSKSGEITITLGLSATHHYIDEVIRPMRMEGKALVCEGATESLQPDSPMDISMDEQMSLESSAHFTSTPVFGISNMDDHTPDVWDPDYTYRAENPSIDFAPDEEADKRRKALFYEPLSCKGINESAGGFCLLGYIKIENESHKVQVGELVGIREDSGTDDIQLGIGIVRRIKSWRNGIELGIQKLSPCAEAIATATTNSKGRNAKFQRSLVLPQLNGINQPATIITHAWHQEGETLIANVHGQKVAIKLTKQLESTGVFSQFEFTLLDKDEPKPKTTPHPDSSDIFESVWSVL